MNLIAGSIVNEGQNRRRKAAGVESGGWKKSLRGSGFDGVAALAVLALCGCHGQALLLADGARQESAQRMRLPVRRLEQLLCGSSARPLQQVEDRGGFATFPRVVSGAPRRFRDPVWPE